ncbi:uncharacterized protein [Spinacia oleracea]|uniref:Uncharacterized protein n=1 Tax=Spinacia oleracea TaxID=3562 RepID=A0ABM3RRZ0_SPIOL|nr:uncharacterized protein LOC130472005 [Spinacia oleracea]
MAIRFPSMLSTAKQILSRNQHTAAVPKGHIPVYVGDQANKKRHVVPLSYLSHPAFQCMLHHAEQEFGFHHLMGGLTIPCSEETFFELTSINTVHNYRSQIFSSAKHPISSQVLLHDFTAGMAIRITSVLSNAKQILNKSEQLVPKGHIPVYVGKQADRKRYVVPLSYLNHPVFQDLLRRAEEEFGFHHPMGGLTIPCTSETFFKLTSELKQ